MPGGTVTYPTDPLAVAMGWLSGILATTPTPPETVEAGCEKRLHRLGVGAPDDPQVCCYCGTRFDA